MKFRLLILVMSTTITMNVMGQHNLNVGMGYAGEALTSPGIVLEIERENFQTSDFSLPARGDISFRSTPDYYGFYVDIHKGFRKYFRSGLFLEQSLGIGFVGKQYKADEYWYQDKYEFMIAHAGKTIWGLMPSVTAGAGYSFSANSGGSNLLWVRPKVFWDLGTRNLQIPYFSMQIGYTHSINTK